MWIRVLAVGIGLMVMGAVAALGRDPAPAPIVEYPVAERAMKGDRLSLVPDHANTVGSNTVGNAANSAAQAPIAVVAPPAPKAEAVPAPRIIARHRHEPTNPNLRKRTRQASQQRQAVPDEKPIRTVDCNGNGLDSLLRSMRLKPGCL
ncbi:hypothetical protein JQ633_21090 [Bradyrhizobium tropiciagri]|uniref:hypothetical protein n=1 Tax=Bradyrhizobium tropiciagri TaxID=312253 RepID=UPI001BA6C0F7|nr:hypothetical protein [Bradyrhizobium tropiciagri]MBR0872871.1 hypothetical protein [Bradyrhizobium tropiciagri]